jgi:2-polyprenyl-3-methyl-5-hydroxy-6-metoxy-1,4-benzoquinol methylase
MESCPLPDIEFEAMLTNIRLTIVKNYNQFEINPKYLPFYNALSTQCYVNEYIYRETKMEGRIIRWIESLSVNYDEIQNFSKFIFLLSCYKALGNYEWITDVSLDPNLSAIFKLQVEEPSLEREISNNIMCIGDIDDKTSAVVKRQYEHNPYPRWQKCDPTRHGLSINDYCERANLKPNSSGISFPQPSILVAGCGTGQHSITSSLLYSDSYVTAIDLSNASIAYAERKTQELNISNISYYNCDILNLEKLNQKFDLIECQGVLHHMSDPKLGWEKLYNQLNYGGYMSIGLYSQHARKHISKIRLETQKVRSTTLEQSDIRKLRYQLILSDEAHHKLALGSSDFYSSSNFRDLLLHMQEFQFTIPIIETYLNDLGLDFCGFTDQNIIKSFRATFGMQSDIYDLRMWQDFELKYPWTFIKMYQFWCQKV